MGGHVGVIWQPWEFVIIGGASLGTFVVANPLKTIKDTGAGIKEAFTGDAPGRQRKMRGERPFVFTNLKTGQGLDTVVRFVVERGMVGAPG